MKNLKTLVLAVCILGAVGPAFGAGIYLQTFPATKDIFFGRNGGVYLTDVNYGTTRYGRVGKANGDSYLVDFNRVAMMTWINTTIHGYAGGSAITITDVNQIGNGALTMNLTVTAYGGAWQETDVPPPTMFGHYYWPGVRLSQGQNWNELTATFNTAAGIGNPWRSSTGTPLANLYTNGYFYMNNTIHNVNSVQWGDAPNNNGTDMYVEDVPRPFLLDDNVALAAMLNPDVVGFQLYHDYKNKAWATANDGNDDCNGQIYSRDHGSPEFRPTLDIMIDVPKIIAQSVPPRTYLPGDCNKDGYVKFADYLILEQNFGKSGKTWADGDFTADGTVKFADYLLLEQNFGKKASWAVPEPATMSLLVLGGVAMLKRRSA